MDKVHECWTMAGSHGPPWTGGEADRMAPERGGVLIGVGPPATPRHGCSLGLGWWCGGQATVRKRRWRRNLAVPTLEILERGKMRGRDVVRAGGGVSLL
jgi:hypothetical protein